MGLWRRRVLRYIRLDAVGVLFNFFSTSRMGQRQLWAFQVPYMYRTRPPKVKQASHTMTSLNSFSIVGVMFSFNEKS